MLRHELGFKADVDVHHESELSPILDEVATFIDKLVREVPKELPEHMSAEEAARLGAKLQRPFWAVQQFRFAVERVHKAVPDLPMLVDFINT